MDADIPAYDPRYLAGALFFNEREYFEAHEVWEDLWKDIPGQERLFYKGLIQAAVALYHFGNGNVRGALKLFRSSQRYMKPFGPSYQGLNVAGFWEDMNRCFDPLLRADDPTRDLRPEEKAIPVIMLSPAPASWPDPAQFTEHEE